MNRKVLLIGLAIVAQVVAILTLALKRNPNEVRSPLIGKTAPPFVLKEVGTGRAVSLEDLRGRPVIVNFWATWCVPCYAEHETLTRAARDRASSTQFIGIVYQDDEKKISEFLQTYGQSYPSLLDDGSRTAIAYGVYGVPETFFINTRGIVVAKHAGPLDGPTINRYLEQATR